MNERGVGVLLLPLLLLGLVSCVVGRLHRYPSPQFLAKFFLHIDQLEDHFRCVAIRVSFLLLLIPINRFMGLCLELLFSRSVSFVAMGLGTRKKLLLSLLL